MATAKMLEAAPDLVVVDWTGDPTAVTLFVHRIRRGELVDPRTPVLALVGPPHNAVLERAWLADEIIAKPISAVDLIERAGGLLEEWRRRTRPEAETKAAE
jgi:DNA-binding response OmpR family regulator